MDKGFGGEGGIRTPDTVTRMPHFECGAFNHSATSPWPQKRETSGYVSNAGSLNKGGRRLALGNLDLAFFRTWALGIFIGALIGTALVPLASTEVLEAIFAAFMLTVGVYEGFLRNTVIAKAAPRGAVKLALSAAIGCLAALTGTGGGTLTTPALQAFTAWPRSRRSSR